MQLLCAMNGQARVRDYDVQSGGAGGAAGLKVTATDAEGVEEEFFRFQQGSLTLGRGRGAGRGVP
jgi:hypothetical protein